MSPEGARMSEEDKQEQAPAPDAGASTGREGETPEQTIAALREALKQANSEAKDNRLKAKELDDIKSAQMSELEKAQASLAEFEKQADAAKAEALRFKIATKYGISEADAEVFLTAADEEMLTKQAERISALAKTPPTPKPDATQGGSGGASNGTTAEQFAAAVGTIL